MFAQFFASFTRIAGFVEALSTSSFTALHSSANFWILLKFSNFFLICSFHKNHRFSWGLSYLPIYCFSLFKFFVIFATACVAVNFLFQLIFVFPLFLGMVMYANEFETKEKQKLTEIKNKLQHMQTWTYLCILVVYTPMKQKPKKVGNKLGKFTFFYYIIVFHLIHWQGSVYGVYLVKCSSNRYLRMPSLCTWVQQDPFV